jgi:short subunit dehydrogenase-like uncharacterized protein
MGDSEQTVGVVGAYGATGRIVTEQLLALSHARLLIAGRDRAKLDALAAELGERVEVLPCDVFDNSELAALSRRVDVVVNCAGPFSRVLERVAAAAYEAGIHYVDPGGETIMFRRLSRLQPALVRKRLSFILGAGLMPGVTGLIAWYASALAQVLFDEALTVDLYFGDVDNWSLTGCEDILALTFDREAFGWYEQGQWKPARGINLLRRSRRVNLPAPFGKRTLVTPQFRRELTTLASCYDYPRVASFVAPQLSRHTLHAWLYIALVARVSRARAAHHLQSLLGKQCRRIGIGSVAEARVRGSREGAETRLRVATTESRGYWVTGLTCALATNALLDGEVIPGCTFLCDSTDPVVFIHRMIDHGLSVTAELDRTPLDGRETFQKALDAERVALPSVAGDGNPARDVGGASPD